MAVIAVLAASSLHALILFTGDNDANQTDPGTGVPFGKVALVCNAGGSSPAGSAVHLRGKYLLTARHVATRSHVTFDGITYWERDTTFSPKEVTTSDPDTSLDLEIIKLVNDPDLPETILTDNTTTDIAVTATLVGYGRGVSEDDNDGNNTWDWGNDSTIAKRWGTNFVTGVFAIEYGSYAFNSLYTSLDDLAGNNEAGLVTYDSGSPMFIQDNDTWKLAGIAVTVTTQGSSTFGGADRDFNFFVRISEIASDIEVALPDLSTFAGWAVDNSLVGAEAEVDADPDLDGLKNLIEFAMGTNPNIPNAQDLPKVSSDGSSINLVYQIDSQANGLDIIAETSSSPDPSGWSDTGVTYTLLDTQNGVETWRASYTTSETRFMRLSVTEL